MTESGPVIAPPSEWYERPNGRRDGEVIQEYEYDPTRETTFLVSLVRRSAREMYELRLTVIDLQSTRLRHDYPVDEYDSREAAVAGAESFIDHLSERFREGNSHRPPRRSTTAGERSRALPTRIGGRPYGVSPTGSAERGNQSRCASSGSVSSR